MKNVFKKAVSLTVALSTVAALSVSAFAAPSATYDADTQAVSVKDYTATGTGQYAVAVVDAGLESYTDANIYYVNQADQATIGGIIANMLVKGELTEGEDYEVRIGNNAGQLASDGTAVEVITFTVEKADDGSTVIYGDLDTDTLVTLKDAIVAMKIGAGAMSATEELIKIGDVDALGDGVTLKDAILIMKHGAGAISKFPCEE